MNQSFDTTAWMLQTALVVVALFAGLPALRAVVGITLIALARGLGYEEGRVHRWGVRILPALLRGVLGVGISMGALTAPAHAAAQPAPIVIDRVVLAAEPAEPVPAPVVAAEPATSGAVYLVAPGDSLWAIAANSLAEQGGDPTVQEVDREWRRLWHLNRELIGADPSMIHPGQRLRLQGGSGA